MITLLFVFGISLSSAAERIVIIGDSHAYGYMGKNLQKSLKKQGHDVELFAVSGSSAKNWLGQQGSMPTFSEIIETKKPQKIIFSLGTNDVFNQCPNEEFFSDNVKKILSIIPKSTTCVWVGPPGYQKGKIISKCKSFYNGLVDGLQKTVSVRCKFIDTRKNVEMLENPKYVEKDTIHMTSVGGEFWNQFILSQMDDELAK